MSDFMGNATKKLRQSDKEITLFECDNCVNSAFDVCGMSYNASNGTFISVLTEARFVTVGLHPLSKYDIEVKIYLWEAKKTASHLPAHYGITIR